MPGMRIDLWPFWAVDVAHHEVSCRVLYDHRISTLVPNRFPKPPVEGCVGVFPRTSVQSEALTRLQRKAWNKVRLIRFIGYGPTGEMEMEKGVSRILEHDILVV